MKMYKRYTLEIMETGVTISGEYTRPKVYQIMAHLQEPASISLYATIPDHRAAIMIYAPPASGKSTFIHKLHERFCSCALKSISSNLQFIDHKYHVVDTDHSIFNRGNIVVTNVYNLMCRADETIAILPSEEEVVSRYDLRGLKLRNEEYNEIEAVCRKATFCIQSDDYVDNLLRFTEL